MECLFCWLAFPALVGVSILFLSARVIECFCGGANKARFRAFFSNFQFRRIRFFTLSKIFPASQNPHGLLPNS